MKRVFLKQTETTETFSMILCIFCFISIVRNIYEKYYQFKGGLSLISTNLSTDPSSGKEGS